MNGKNYFTCSAKYIADKSIKDNIALNIQEKDINIEKLMTSKFTCR